MVVGRCGEVKTPYCARCAALNYRFRDGELCRADEQRFYKKLPGQRKLG